MNIVVDTNVLLRAIVQDDDAQARAAVSTLAAADVVVIPLVALCEYAWVLAQGYGFDRKALAAAIRDLADTDKIRMDRRAAEAGLAYLTSGADFADGVIAFDGRRNGGDVFVSFDRRAVRTARMLGGAARRPETA